MKTELQFQEITCLKVIALLLVILSHITLFYSNSDLYSSVVPSPILKNLTSYLYTFHVPIFIFISGYLYCYGRIKLGKYHYNWTFIKSKFIKLMIPYLFVASFFILPIKIYLGFYDDSSNIIKDVAEDFILVSNVHNLWFLPALFEIMIIFKFLERYIVRSNCILVFVLLSIINCYSYHFPWAFQISNASKHLIYFYLGYIAFQRQEILSQYCKIKYGLSYFLLHFVTCISLYYLKRYSEILIIREMLAIIPLVLGIFGIAFAYIFANIFLKKNPNIVNNYLYEILNRYNFSIYLFHEGIILIILKFSMNMIIFPPILVVVTFGVSIVISVIFSRILENNKYLKFIIGS